MPRKRYRDAMKAIDDLTHNVKKPNDVVIERRREIFNGAQNTGRLVMTSDPVKRDGPDACLVLMVSIAGGPMIRVPLGRGEIASLAHGLVGALA